eukprot:TRINITY_DN2334_c0_g1_i3.p1 TRINITY_DN2334_c0_g1~~TRINITY_DN2334_c0_g1_i3.p1  ORF type:complete len:366 (+),score=130.80 TRINITY_DN2334_c0_g1_i3:88-1185(+)
MGGNKNKAKKEEPKKVVEKEESSSSDSESDSSSSEEEVQKVKAVKKDESSSEEDSSSDSEEETKVQPKKEETKKATKKESSSEEDSSSDSESEEEEKKKNGTKEESSSSEESDSDSDSDSEEEDKKETEKRKADEVDEESAPKRIKNDNGYTPVAPNSASARVFVGNLSYSIDDDSIKQAFAEIGEVRNVEWLTDKTTGKFYGCGFLTFETPEIASQALSLNGTDVLGRPMKVEPESSRQGNKKAPAPFNSTKPLSQKPEGCTTVFLGNLSFQIQDENIYELFQDCGEISQIRWLNDKETGNFKGCGFVEFVDSESTAKAVAHNGEDVMGRTIRIDYSESKPKDQNQRGGGGQRGGRGGRGGKRW